MAVRVSDQGNFLLDLSWMRRVSFFPCGSLCRDIKYWSKQLTQLTQLTYSHVLIIIWQSAPTSQTVLICKASPCQVDGGVVLPVFNIHVATLLHQQLAYPCLTSASWLWTGRGRLGWNDKCATATMFVGRNMKINWMLETWMLQCGGVCLLRWIVDGLPSQN